MTSVYVSKDQKRKWLQDRGHEVLRSLPSVHRASVGEAIGGICIYLLAPSKGGKPHYIADEVLLRFADVQMVARVIRRRVKAGGVPHERPRRIASIWHSVQAERLDDWVSRMTFEAVSQFSDELIVSLADIQKQGNLQTSAAAAALKNKTVLVSSNSTATG